MKLAAVILLSALPMMSASWDGKRDDLTIITSQFRPSALPGILGIAPNTPDVNTIIWVSSSDSTVAAFRITVTYLLNGDSKTATAVVATLPNSYMTSAFFAGIAELQITSVEIARLRESGTTVLH